MEGDFKLIPQVQKFDYQNLKTPTHSNMEHGKKNFFMEMTNKQSRISDGTNLTAIMKAHMIDDASSLKLRSDERRFQQIIDIQN